MLKINDKEYNVTLEEISVGRLTYNGVEGYQLKLYFEFLDESCENGYIDLHCGYEAENDINYFVNRDYEGYNFETDDGHIWLEMFDTINYYDSEIDDLIKVKVKDMEDDNIYVEIDINNELVDLKYDGKMNYIELEG